MEASDMDKKPVSPRNDTKTPVDGVDLPPMCGADAAVQAEGENLSVRTQPKHSDAYIENEGLVKQTSREATAQAKVIKEL
jgi:hypothetical protein